MTARDLATRRRGKDEGMNTDVSALQAAASGAELIGLLSEQCGLYE